eukprot:8790272-Pyramimonas_sp.AAC.1
MHPAKTRVAQQTITPTVAQYITRSLSQSRKRSSQALVQGMRSHMTRRQLQLRKTLIVRVPEARTPQE